MTLSHLPKNVQSNLIIPLLRHLKYRDSKSSLAYRNYKSLNLTLLFWQGKSGLERQSPAVIVNELLQIKGKEQKRTFFV